MLKGMHVSTCSYILPGAATGQLLSDRKLLTVTLDGRDHLG